MDGSVYVLPRRTTVVDVWLRQPTWTVSAYTHEEGRSGGGIGDEYGSDVNYVHICRPCVRQFAASRVFKCLGSMNTPIVGATLQLEGIAMSSPSAREVTVDD